MAAFKFIALIEVPPIHGIASSFSLHWIQLSMRVDNRYSWTVFVDAQFFAINFIGTNSNCLPRVVGNFCEYFSLPLFVLNRSSFFSLSISFSRNLDCSKFSTIFPLAICFTSATPHVQTDFHRIHSISVHLISILCMPTLCDYWLHITHNCNDPTATANIYFIQIDFKVAIVIAWLTAILMHGESVWFALCILNGICV